MTNKPSTPPSKPVTNLIKRYNMTIFIVVIVIGLIASVWILNEILSQQPSDNTNSATSSSTTTTFDQTTIDRLNKLTTSNDSSGEQVLPSARINPFSG
jgi:hypothetical protein